MGSPILTDLWVDPIHGDDTQAGTTRSTALKSLSAAWQKIPPGLLSTTGYHIRVTSGTVQNAPVYWEARHASRIFPIIIEAQDGPGTTKVCDAMTRIGHYKKSVPCLSSFEYCRPK